MRMQSAVLAMLFVLAGCAPSASNPQPDATNRPPTDGATQATSAPTGASHATTDEPEPTSELAPAPTDAPSESTRPINTIIEFDVRADSHPHDVAPAPDGKIWYTAQFSGALGVLDPATGEYRHIELPAPSAPHGVIAGPDGAAWITDSDHNAIIRVDGVTEEITVYPLPEDQPNANLNTAAFDGNGDLWFTGQNGIYGRVDLPDGEVTVWDAPRGRGPYGITATPDGQIYYASLAGNHIAHVNTETGEATVIEPPTANQGARRVWSDSQGRIWVSEWDAGQLGMYDPASEQWREWKLPGGNPQAYAVYVDETDMVWVTDFGGNAIHRFDPTTESFETFTFPDEISSVRQVLGRAGEIWGAESAWNRLFVIYTASSSTPAVSYRLDAMPGVLDCSIVETTQHGQIWNGLTVGESTRAQVNEQLADLAYSSISPRTGNLLFRRTGKDDDTWMWIEVCFNEQDVLNAIGLHGTEKFPRTVDQWLEAYGRPDRVTWGDDYYTRSLIWAELGILAIINVESNTTYSVLLVPPIPAAQLETSWLMLSLPQQAESHTVDLPPLPDEKEVEDPWGIEK